MKPLCIVDTCSFIYMSEIELAGRSLHRWLWDEFDVRYSQAVWEEIKQNARKMGRDAKYIKRHSEKQLWPLPEITTYENALFAEYSRRIETGYCRQCKRPFYGDIPFTPDLTSPKDRGERHNCCVALNAVMAGNQRQVIFLTDDLKAIRDYVDPVFSTFPLGYHWSSYDFVLYLFVRHRKRILQGMVQDALHDIATRAIRRPPSKGDSEYEVWLSRLKAYRRKIKRIDQSLGQIKGGR